MMEYLWMSPETGFNLRNTMPRSSSIDIVYILSIECTMCSFDFHFSVNVGCVLGKPTYLVLCLK